jgi:hypothetical protein
MIYNVLAQYTAHYRALVGDLSALCQLRSLPRETPLHQAAE